MKLSIRAFYLVSMLAILGCEVASQGRVCQEKGLTFPLEDLNMERDFLYTGRQLQETLLVFNITSRLEQHCVSVFRRFRLRHPTIRFCSRKYFRQREERPMNTTCLENMHECKLSEETRNYGTKQLQHYIKVNATTSFMAVWSFQVPADNCVKLCLRSSLAGTDKLYIKTDQWIETITAHSAKHHWSEFSRFSMNDSYVSMIYVYNPHGRKVLHKPYLQFSIARSPVSCSCTGNHQLGNECKILHAM